eukprot:767446-Hanusia_phi.AAC.1
MLLKIECRRSPWIGLPGAAGIQLELAPRGSPAKAQDPGCSGPRRSEASLSLLPELSSEVDSPRAPPDDHPSGGPAEWPAGYSARLSDFIRPRPG